MPEQANISQSKFALDKRYLIFCFFVIISLALWLMNKLSAEYSANIQFSLKITNSLTGGTYTNNQNQTISIQAKARGFYIVGKQLSKKQTLNIDLKDARLVSGKKSENLIKISTASIKDKISEALGRDVELVAIEPDTLYLNYSIPIHKKVPVVQNFTLAYQNEYMQTAPITFEPDSVTITGQSEILDTINAIKTEYANFLNLNSKLETSLSLANIENVIISQNKVRIFIPIERCTESSIKLPITILNAPESSSILLLPPNVEVRYVVPLKGYSNINKDDFQAIVDYIQTDSQISTRKLRVKLISKPQQVISTQLLPEFVDFIEHKE